MIRGTDRDGITRYGRGRGNHKRWYYLTERYRRQDYIHVLNAGQAEFQFAANFYRQTTHAKYRLIDRR